MDFKDIKKMTKADLVNLIQLILSALNTIESGDRFDYKLGALAVAGKSLDYGVYVVESSVGAREDRKAAADAAAFKAKKERASKNAF